MNFLLFLYGLSIGFEFSDVEPSAMVQRQGGPCAVIAPVQAFILKTIITETHGHSFGDVRTFISLNDFIYVKSVYCAISCVSEISQKKQKLYISEHYVTAISTL